jgi:hypothetical protein
LWLRNYERDPLRPTERAEAAQTRFQNP